MLIVPTDQRFDLRRPPLVTMLLILACTVVFLGYQLGDAQRATTAMSHYVESGLLEKEQHLLTEYARAEFGGELPTGVAENMATLAPVALRPGFDTVVREYWEDHPPGADWRTRRLRFEAYRDELSWVRFGLQPANVEPVPLFSHMFMHGGFAHLLGNMVFLFLFGVALERLVGSTRFAIIYAVTGLTSAGLFILMNLSSHAPLVGASGAISGLMGAFIGIHGMRRVRFFYTVGFWFGEFAAPALLVFPLWLLKELYGFYFADTQVAYMAHAGGLIGGLLLGMMMRKRSGEALDAETEERAAAELLQRRVARIQELMTDMRLDEARQLAEKSIQENPAASEYWQMYANVAERLPGNETYHRVINTIFLNAGKKAMPANFLLDVVKAYREKIEAPLPALRGRAGAALVRRLFREGRSADVDRMIDIVMQQGRPSPEMQEFLRQLIAYAERNQDRRRTERYRKYLSAGQA